MWQKKAKIQNMKRTWPTVVTCRWRGHDDGKVWLSEAEKVSQLASSKEMDSANNLNDPGSEPPRST